MSRRRLIPAIAGSLALATLTLMPLSSATAEPTGVPAADDIVGAGSDTTMFALDNLAYGTTIDGVFVPGYNQGKTSALLQSWDAGPSYTANITPKAGAAETTRPNGSGDGKSRLYGSGDNPAFNFARSSSALSSTEVSNGLWAVPFAADGLKMAVDSANTNAPAGVTAKQLVDIYQGTTTNWKDLGGQDAPIHPLIPQAGSGTRSFFLGLLKAANGGVDITLDTTKVKETQEHSDTDIKADPDAIAPFSTGRARSLSTVKLLADSAHGGFDATRAVYDVVRQADLTAPWFAPIFGENGFICSDAAKTLIYAGGLDQLARSNGTTGVCGQPTQGTTTDFTLNGASSSHATATKLGVTISGQKVSLKATVSSDSLTPVGSVTFKDGTKTVGTVNVQGGVGLKTLTGVAPGSHSYKAVYTSSSSLFTGSTSAVRTVAVKGASKTTVSMKSTFSATTRQKAIVAVTTLGHAAAGKVLAKLGTKTLASGALSRGKVTITLPKLTRGKHTLTFAYLGNATTAASRATKTVTVTR